MLDAWNVNTTPQVEEEAAPKGRTGKSGRAIYLVVLALILAAGAFEWRRRQAEPEVVAAKPAATTTTEETKRGVDTVTIGATQARQLVVAPAARYDFAQSRDALGQIAFNEDASTIVVAPFSGRATRLIAKVGDEVKRGDPLLEVESAEVVQAHTELIASIYAAEKSGAQLNLARRVVDRQVSLLGDRATSQREVEQARAELAVAQAEVASAQGAVASARNKLRLLTGRSEEDVERVQREKIVSATAVVTAPIDGVIVARRVGPGQYVRSESGEALYTISDMSQMWLKASLPETEAPFVKVDQRVEVRVNALPGRVFKASVKSIGASSDAVTRRVVVQSVIENPDRALRAEMFASFRIFTGEAAPTLAVPTEALVREGARAFVWVEEKPLTYRRRRVVIGAEQDGRTQILEGVEANERVVGQGAIFVDNEWKQ